MRKHLLAALILQASLGILFQSARAEAGTPDTAAPSKNMIFCYQDIELYPNYTGNSAVVPASNRGINVELVELATAQAGYKPTFVRFPWKRCIALMKLGRVDSVIASYRAERLNAAVYPLVDGKPDNSKLITLSSYYLYQKRGSLALWNGTEFTSPASNIGAPLGYSISAELKDRGLNVVEAGTTEGLLHMLLYDRLHAVAAPGAAADTLLRNHHQEYASIKRVDVPLKINHYFIVFSHQFYDQAQEAAQAIWQASPQVYQGHFAELQEKYALPVK